MGSVWPHPWKDIPILNPRSCDRVLLLGKGGLEVAHGIGAAGDGPVTLGIRVGAPGPTRALHGGRGRQDAESQADRTLGSCWQPREQA